MQTYICTYKHIYFVLAPPIPDTMSCTILSMSSGLASKALRRAPHLTPHMCSQSASPSCTFEHMAAEQNAILTGVGLVVGDGVGAGVCSNVGDGVGEGVGTGVGTGVGGGVGEGVGDCRKKKRMNSGWKEHGDLDTAGSWCISASHITPGRKSVIHAWFVVLGAKCLNQR
jgi:hypothetical protein